MADTELVIKARPSNLDLQDAIVETHGCVHQVGKQVAAVKQQVGDQALQIDVIARAMGVKLPTPDELRAGVLPAKVHRRLGGMSPIQAAGMVMASVAGAKMLYRILEPAVVALAPALMAATVALGHGLMGAAEAINRALLSAH